MLDIVQVRTFLTIADVSSISEAASKLRLSQPAVSQHLSKLEQSLGTRLFRRDRGGCHLTLEGTQLLPYARELVNAEAKCRDALAGDALTVAASSNIGTYHLPALMQSYYRKRNGRRLVFNVSIGTNMEVYKRLESGSADIGLTEWWDNRDGFTAVEWRRDPMVAIVHPRHKWSGKRGININEACAVPLIGGEAGTGTVTMLKQALGQKTAQLRVSMTLGSTEAVKQAVIAGLGVSLVMRSAVEREVNTGALVAIQIIGAQLEKRFFAICPKDRCTTASSQFASFLVEKGRNSALRK